MKKQLLLSICLIAFSIFSQAQQVKVNLGPELSLKDGYVYDAVLYADASGYYAVKLKDGYKGMDLHIEKFNYTHHSLFDHNFTTNMEHTYFESIVQTRKNFQVIFYHDDVKKQVREIYTTIIDHDGNISSNPILLASFPTNLKLAGSVTKIKGKENIDFDVIVNGDSTRLLLYASPTISADAPCQFYFKEFDLDGKVVQDKQIKTDWVEAQVLLLGFEVDLQDNIFVMARVYKQSKGKGKDIDYPETMGHFKDKVLNYENKLLRYSKGSNEPKEYTLDINGKSIGDFFVTYTKNNDFVLTGLYFHNIDQDAYEGCIYMRIDAQGNAKAGALSEFPQSLEETASKAIMVKEDKVKYPGPHFDPFDATAEDDGSAIMVCDYRYTIIITHSDGRGNTYTSYEYYNMDITSMKFSPDGKLVWVKSLPLYRRSESNPDVVGQIFFRGKNTYNFVYCDSKKNLMANREESNDPKKWDSKEYIVELGSLDATTGNIKRSILFDKDKQNIDEQLSFDKSVNIAGLNGVMLAGEVSGVFKGTRYRFVEITMNN